MAVNTQKLLPSAKGSPLAKISTAKISKGMSIKTKKIDTKKLIGTREDETENIKKTLLDIDSLLKSILGEEKKNQSKKRKEKEKSDFEKEEKKLEAPKETKKFKLPGLNVPGASFLDRIKRFLFFTALGWLFTRFQDQLPKLEGIIKTITQVYVVAEGIFKSLLTGLINFVDIGYQTYDGLRKKVEDLGGKDAAKTFDEFSGHLNKLINGAIMASLLIASTNPKILSTSKKSTGGAAAAGAPKQPPTKQKILPPAGPRGPLDRIGRGIRGAGAQLQTGTLFKRGAGLQKALYNAPGKLKGAIPKGVRVGAGKIPVLGPLITFGVRTLVYGEKPEKAAAAAVGTGIGQAIGGFIGTIGAGALGLGTAGLGAVVAPLIIGAGSVIGALVGEWIGAKLYDFVASLGDKNKPQLKAAGGSVTRGGKRQGAVSRSIRTTRNKRPPKVKPKQSQPGKDIGGKKNIQKLYPDPSAITEIEGEQKSPWFDLLPKDPKKKNEQLKKLPNPYKALTGVAKTLKDIPFGIGALMGGAVDIALGEKLPQNAIDSLGNGISYLINAVASRQVSASISDIGKEITKMQTGGVVPRLRDFSKQDQMGSDINKVLNNLIRQKVDQAIKEVQKQMMPGKFDDEIKPTPPPDDQETMPPGPGSDQPSSPGQFNIIEYITGDPNTPTGRFDRAGHGTTENYHDHIAFKTEADKERAKKALRDAGIKIGSEYRPGDPGYHGANLAIDVPGYQWGGTGEIGQKEYAGSAKVRQILGLGGSKTPDQETKKQKPSDTKSTKKLKGQISFYGTKEDGFGYEKGKMITASGEKFIPSGLTAAHKTLPFGTKLKVTNPNNGKTVTVTVNDRGPFVGDRVLDLSYGAARAIGMTGSGVIDGEIEVLGKQGGGYIPKQSPNRKVSSLRSYPSYSEGGMMIAIQPMIIEKPVPMPMGNSKTIMFPVPVGVNNSMNLSNLSQG